MRGSLLQTWTPASLFLTALLMIGAATSGRHTEAVHFGNVPGADTAIPQCAAPTSMSFGRWPELAHRVAPRQAAMFAVLMARRGRLGRP